MDVKASEWSPHGEQVLAEFFLAIILHKMLIS